MKIAVVRVRGRRNLDPKIRKTLELLGLHKPNHCVLVDDNPRYMGMLNVVKDYVTFGAVDEETILHLIRKKGKKGSKKLADLAKDEELKAAARKIAEGAKVKDFADPIFTLAPPRKGWKDIKQPFPKGDLGARPNMGALLKRMS